MALPDDDDDFIICTFEEQIHHLWSMINVWSYRDYWFEVVWSDTSLEKKLLFSKCCVIWKN